LDRVVEAARAEVLAVVQARGGSKSIPRKNARPLAGHPLIAYSIAAALDARRVTRLIVSTDDQELAAIAKDYGAEVPFMRPEELAQDDTPDLPLFQHALHWLRECEGYEPDVVVQLRPTSPLRPAGLVDQAVEELLANGRADSARGVTLANQNPYKMWKVREDGFLQPLMEGVGLVEPYNVPRQLLPQILWQTGHIDVIRFETIRRDHSLTGQNVLPIVIDRRYCIDIDTEADWAYANWIVAHGQLPMITPKGRAALHPLKRIMPLHIALLVVDFDGVLTDNRVWIAEQGTESVVCDRSDGLGMEMLQRSGVNVFVLSKESNPVVAARCGKLGIAFRQGLEDKHAALLSLAAERKVGLAQIAYVGNDVNDLPCMAVAGCGIAVADAHPEVLERADIILKTPGGRGAIREVCDLILATNRHAERRRHG
jgi:YrbI family 3-deoxy-D-manno-octulosonate 8-phosphate phosphatase